MSERAVVLFDGLCNLCNGTVRFIIANDPGGHFAFASLQSDAARDALRRAGAGAVSGEGVVLIENGRVFTSSEAALRVATSLRFPWPLLGVLFALPASLRERAYATVARNRYRWFGKRDACSIPAPGERERFL